VPPVSASTYAESALGAGSSKRAPQRRLTHGRVGYLFVAPFIVTFATLFVLPLVYAAYISLYKNRLIGGLHFVGLDNYIRAVHDPSLQQGVARVAVYFVIQVPIMLAIALFAALAIDSEMLRLSKVFRLGIFLPYAVPAVVATLMWGYLYGPSFGPFAQLATKLGVTAPDFLNEPWVLPSIANIQTWEFVGYNMIIMYAALRSIPSDLYEAAAVDGAGARRIAWSIKIPSIRRAIGVCLIFSVIGSFQLFSEPKLLQPLSPNVIQGDYTPNLYAYTLAFTSQDTNYAAAVSFLLGLVIVIVSYAVILLGNRRSQS
jgi:multiple sugar transport system permease protein